MNREITMESVFQAGFKAGYTVFLDKDDELGSMYFASRNGAWLEYVKSLAANPDVKDI